MDREETLMGEPHHTSQSPRRQGHPRVLPIGPHQFWRPRAVAWRGCLLLCLLLCADGRVTPGYCPWHCRRPEGVGRWGKKVSRIAPRTPGLPLCKGVSYLNGASLRDVEGKMTPGVGRWTRSEPIGSRPLPSDSARALDVGRWAGPEILIGRVLIVDGGRETSRALRSNTVGKP